MLAKEDTAAPNSKPSSSGKGGQGMLMDTSSMSRKLANGKGPGDHIVMKAILANNEAMEIAATIGLDATATKAAYSPEFLFALCRTYGSILARWGGGGRDDIIKGVQWENPMSFREGEERKAQATSTADPLTRSLLNVLCFSTPLVQASWALTQSHTDVVSGLYSVIDTKRR